MAQGYFKKPNSFDEIKDILKQVVDYWDRSSHPNSN
jgi:hypothetical protein